MPAETTLAELKMEGYVPLAPLDPNEPKPVYGAMKLDRPRSIRQGGVYQHGKKGDYLVLDATTGDIVMVPAAVFAKTFARDPLLDADIDALVYHTDIDGDEDPDVNHSALAFARLTMN